MLFVLVDGWGADHRYIWPPACRGIGAADGHLNSSGLDLVSPGVVA